MTTPTKCQRCGKTFKGGDKNTACAVMHQAGDCCHYGQTEVHQLPNEPDKSKHCPVCNVPYTPTWYNRHLVKAHGWRYENEIAVPPTQPDSTTEKHNYVWYSFCSAHQTIDSQCTTCHKGSWTDENDLEVIADRKLYADDPDEWRKKKNAAQPSPSLDELVRDAMGMNGMTYSLTNPAYQEEAEKRATTLVQAITALIEAEKLSEYRKGRRTGYQEALKDRPEEVMQKLVAMADELGEDATKLAERLALQDEHKEEV